MQLSGGEVNNKILKRRCGCFVLYSGGPPCVVCLVRTGFVDSSHHLLHLTVVNEMHFSCLN